MKVREFIDAMKKNPTKENATLQSIIKTKYVPILEKRKLAELVYENSTEMENGLVKVDSLSKYIIFTVLMLSRYTTLEFTFSENDVLQKEAVDEYDALCSEGMLDKIISCFKEDYMRANEILNYVFKDNLSVENSLEAVISDKADGVLDIIDTFVNALASKVNDLNMDLSSIDQVQLEKVINMLNNNFR
jgi:uncharacterized protein YjgD (DUF1641 family)